MRGGKNWIVLIDHHSLGKAKLILKYYPKYKISYDVMIVY